MIIKHITPDLEVSESIIIVGNSGNILNREYGAMIDSFGTVARFNRAPTEGFEKYVGSKTDLRIVNPNVFLNIPFDKEGQPKDFVRDLRNFKIVLISPQEDVHLKKNRNVHETCEVYHLPIESYKEICINKNLPPRRARHTTGFNFIKLCIISGLVPSVIGFGVDEVIKSHFWEIHKDQSSHDVNSEHDILIKWDKQMKIKLIL